MEDIDDIQILVEWSNQPEVQKLSRARMDRETWQKEAEKAINLAMGMIQGMAYEVSKTIREMRQESCPSEVEVEFSVKLEMEGGMVLPMVAKTSTGGQLTVKLRWDVEKPAPPSPVLLPNLSGE
jgi:hypothetical protein